MNNQKPSTIYEVSKKQLFATAEAGESAQRALPTPIRDLAELKADLDVHGYCIVADALSPQDVMRLTHRLKEQWQAEHQAGVGIPNPTGVHSVCNLLNKGDIFQKVVLHPVVDKLIEHMLGESFLISAICGAETVPGSKAQGLHIDQFLFGVPTEFPLVANAFFILEDFTEENGATRIIPGSHKWTPEQVAAVHEGLDVAQAIGEDGNPPGTIAAAAPAGSCFVFEGRLLHGAGCNNSTDKTRCGITSYYCRPWMRPFTNAFLSMSDDILETFSPELRAQLGYTPWGLAGGYQVPGAPAPLDTIRPVTQVREMKP